MSYTSTAALIVDEGFVDRVEVCAVEQAKVMVNDQTVSGSDRTLAIEILASMVNGARLVPIVATEPSFSDLYDEGGQEAISDGMILSAVQQRWSLAALPFVPTTPTQPMEAAA
jgi:hypothetical protein